MANAHHSLPPRLGVLLQKGVSFNFQPCFEELEEPDDDMPSPHDPFQVFSRRPAAPSAPLPSASPSKGSAPAADRLMPLASPARKPMPSLVSSSALNCSQAGSGATSSGTAAKEPSPRFSLGFGLGGGGGAQRVQVSNKLKRTPADRATLESVVQKAKNNAEGRRMSIAAQAAVEASNQAGPRPRARGRAGAMR